METGKERAIAIVINGSTPLILDVMALRASYEVVAGFHWWKLLKGHCEVTHGGKGFVSIFFLLFLRSGTLANIRTRERSNLTLNTRLHMDLERRCQINLCFDIITALGFASFMHCLPTLKW